MANRRGAGTTFGETLLLIAVGSAFVAGSIVSGLMCTERAYAQANPQGIPAPSASKSDQMLAQQVRRVENGIVPSVLSDGMPIPTATIAERMKALHVGGGVNIAFIRNGKIQWTLTYGVTGPGGPKVRPETLFQGGSISKAVTAMAVLHLVESAQLDLDTDVNNYLKSWKVPSNQFTEKTKVTLRELLRHTAGVTVHGFRGYATGEPVPTTLVQVLNGEKPANNAPVIVDAEPNTIWRYSGGGYVIIQQLVEDVTGIPFAQFIQDTVFGPIGMEHSTFEQPLSKNLFTEAAMPYINEGIVLTAGPHTYPEMAPAGLWTTPSDLARFTIEIQNSLSGKSNRVLSTAMTKQMLTPGLGSWGLGVKIGGGKHPYFAHGGGTAGYACHLIAYENGDGVVIMTNAYNGPEIFYELERTIAHEYGWPEFQPERRRVAVIDSRLLDKYVGHYRMASGEVSVVTRRGNQLFERQIGSPAYRLYPLNNHDFFLTDWTRVNATITFIADADSPATSLVFHENGKDDEALGRGAADATRIDDRDPAATWTDTILGNIEQQNQSPGTETKLRELIDGLWRGQPNYDLSGGFFVSVLRRLVGQYKPILGDRGLLRSMTFEGVTLDGEDIYHLDFANGSMDWRIGLDANGKIASAGVVAGSE